MEDEEQLRLQLEGEELERSKGQDESGDNNDIDSKEKDYEWDDKLKGWFPRVDTDFLAAYQLSYGHETENTKEAKRGESQSKDVVKYVDPQTKKVYVWCGENFLWINPTDPADTMVPQTIESHSSSKYTDPSTGLVYVWSVQNNQWVAENFIDPQTGTTYTWNEKEGKYLPPGGIDYEEAADDSSDKNSDQPKPKR